MPVPPRKERMKKYSPAGSGSYRPKSGIWARFTACHDPDAEEVSCWACNLCSAKFAPHATRMSEHYQREHPEVLIAPLAQRKHKQLLLPQFGDRKWPEAEQESCMRAMALAWVSNGWALGAVESEETVALLRCLRQDFQPPSKYLLRKAINDVYLQTASEVEKYLHQGDLKFAMIDGWEDPQRMQLFGLSVCFSPPPGA